MVPTDLEMAGRLALAGFLGGLIGLEREAHGQAAGLRTHSVVCLGACLIMLVSLYIHGLNPERSDPGRIAAQVVAGIGFLGAGAILRFGMTIKGLTTAACLWTAAGIGLAVGCGYWKAATGATFLTLVTVLVLDRIERAILHGRSFRKILVRVTDSAGIVGRLEKVLEGYGLGIKEVDIQRDVMEKRLQITLLATCEQTADVDAISRGIGGIEGVERVEIE